MFRSQVNLGSRQKIVKNQRERFGLVVGVNEKTDEKGKRTAGLILHNPFFSFAKFKERPKTEEL